MKPLPPHRLPIPRYNLSRLSIALLLVGLIVLAVTGGALAAEFAGDENVYRLAAGEVVNDDLYVGSGEIYIDGTVKGDLIAFGGYIEINGIVEGDLIAAGGGIVLRGQVMDDVRVAGAGIHITGAVGDDLFAAGGGGQGVAFPVQIGNRSIQQGIRLGEPTQIGGDAVIVGGDGRIDGQIGGDLWAAMGMMTLLGQVQGNAEMQVGSLRVEEGSRVAGTLRYTSPDETAIPAAVSGEIRYDAPTPAAEQQVSFVARAVGWLVRTVLMLAGFALLGWLLLRFAPTLLTRPVAAIQEKPLESGLYGLLASVLLIFIPILSILLVVLVGFFWGAFSAVVTALFLLGGLALVWLFSPLITGLWLGEQIVDRAGQQTTAIVALLVGVLLLVVIGRIPILGWLVYLLSFALALGGVLRGRRMQSPAAGSDGGGEPAAPVLAAEGGV